MATLNILLLLSLPFLILISLWIIGEIFAQEELRKGNGQIEPKV